MLSDKRQGSQQELVNALEKGWKHSLSHLRELSEEKQVRYARVQGFTYPQDVLVHILA